jgi:drug/metabolite transporter (DMT)-like permease
LATQARATDRTSRASLHSLGVICGLAAAAWLGAAEAPTKLVMLGFSPFMISLGMVAGVFVARWTVPMALKGSAYVFLDLKEKPHLIVWGILAGALWATANTLTVFAIRDVGLSVAFPLWNMNSLVGLFWGWLLFNELRDAGAAQKVKVLGGGLAIAIGATVIGLATSQQASAASSRTIPGIMAALGAGLLWGTMYIPYRKAYISGINPLSFVTVFTVGELATMGILAVVFQGGPAAFLQELGRIRPALFWLFLGGLCWVIGDLFQQYAAKYIGIARGIPLSNLNQLWGLAWGVLVFGELAGRPSGHQAMVIGGSMVMIAGAISISRAEAPDSEKKNWDAALRRECDRYGMDIARVEAAVRGEDPLARGASRRRWWEVIVFFVAAGILVWLGRDATRQPLGMNPLWTVLLAVATLASLFGCAWVLWKRTRFS